MVEEGRVEGGTSEKLSRQDVENGYRLACRSRVVEDLVVRIPIESEVDAAVLNMQATPRRTARIREMNLDSLDALWSTQGGFQGHPADDVLDCEYTYYGLLSLGDLVGP